MNNKNKPQTKGKNRDEEKLAKILQPSVDYLAKSIDADIIRKILLKNDK